LALVERGLPVILFAAPGQSVEDALELLRWLREHDADCLVITEDERLLELATTGFRLELPRLVGEKVTSVGPTSASELLAPIPYILPGQLLAHYLALHKGLDPDQPRSISKVTRTR
jgi:glucosamine--fructose-6-phosphate aminotransferase (isomerizing)